MRLKLNNIFRLSWKRFGLIVLAFILSVILHNAIYGLTGVEEAVFFLLAVIVIPIYFIISVIYSIVVFFMNKCFKSISEKNKFKKKSERKKKR